MEPTEIKELIKNKPEYTIAALLKLYGYQTEDEQLVHGTRYQNKIGFNAIDAGILTDISKFYLLKGYLSEKQVQLVRTKVLKYSDQLSKLGELVPVDLKKPEAKKERTPKSNKKEIQVFNELKLKPVFDFDMDIVNKIKLINGRSFDIHNKYWLVPFTITAIDNLVEIGFEMSPEVKLWYSKQTEGITADISIPDLDDKLRPFQKLAVSFIESKQGRALIADEMGLGKSLEALAWVVYRGRSVFPVLIVCPATLKLNWEIEIKKWTKFGKDVEILSGTQPYVIKKPIAIINYDILYDWYENILNDFKPSLVIADEQHLVKSRGCGFKTINGVKRKVVLTQRSYALEEIAKKVKYFIGLTGTPILNRPAEIYNPIKMINPKLFPNWNGFAYRYCDPSFNGFATVFTGASNQTELNQVLTKNVMIRRKKEDVLKELPPKTYVFQHLEISNRKEYDKAEADFIQYLREYNPSKVAKAKNAEALVKLNALRQLAAFGKLKESINWISNFIESEKLVVFAHHTKIIDAIEKAFPNSVRVDGRVTGENRQKAIETFQNTDCPLFIGQNQAASVGITLTSSSNIVLIEYPFSPGIYTQICDRCHRIGQTEAVTIWNLVVENSIEVQFVKLLEEKSKVISAIIDGDDTEDNGLFNDLILTLKG